MTEVERINYQSMATQLLPSRPRDMHKGQAGHVLVIGGEQGMTGAVRMAAEAAARVGAGLVSVATRHDHAVLISQACPEVMAHGVETAAELLSLMAKASIVAIGPGLGQQGWGKLMFAAALASQKKMVVDADALNLLAQDQVERMNWILTPHAGEAGRLLQRSTEDIVADRSDAAAMLQQRYGGVAILKGAGTLVCHAGKIAVCEGGNPGMASGGMGDVLTGVIAGLWAQGLTESDAARLGVCVHAEAADRAANDGERGMLASDVIAQLRSVVNPKSAG